MPTENIVALLIAERDKLNRAIEALRGPTKRRGRPPKNPAEVAPPAAVPVRAKRKRRKFTAAQRKQQAEKMRQYWAAKKKAAAKVQKTVGKPKKTGK